MSKYVDADAVNEVCPCGYCEGYDSCLKKIQVLSSIDIVRCSECKYFENHNCVKRHQNFWRFDDFCSYGERKDDAEHN